MGERALVERRLDVRASGLTLRPPGKTGSSPFPSAIELQRLAGNRAVTSLLADAAQTNKGRSPILPPIGGARKESFAREGRALGLDSGQVDELWSIGSRHGDGFAPSEQRTGALFAAAHKSATGGIPTFYVQMKVGNLADLNKERGHSGADAAMARARTATFSRLKAMFPEIQPMADRASGFGFIVAGDASLTEARLQRAATFVANAVRFDEGVPLEAFAMPVGDAAAGAVDMDEFVASSAGSARENVSPARFGPPQGGPEASFTSSGSDRRSKFIATAKRFGVAETDALHLYGRLLESAPDKLTGFEKAADREETVRKAAEHVGERGVAAMYVEIDIRNVGGLNDALGKRQTDEWFVRITSITQKQMASLSGLADAIPFRHGGDEFSFVVVARRPDVEPGILREAVVTALDQASSEIADATRTISGVEHSKGADHPSGTGIVWGASTIGPRQSTEEVFAAADQIVEKKKYRSLTPSFK